MGIAAIHPSYALHDRTHGWTLSMAFLAACVGVLLVGGYLACRPRYLEDNWQ